MKSLIFAWVLLMNAICFAVEFDVPEILKEGDSTYGVELADVRISGVAQGGEITLVFPPHFIHKNVQSVTVATVAGETASQIAGKLRAKFRAVAPFNVIELGKDDYLTIGGAAPGEIALRGTDGGLLLMPPVANIVAIKTLANEAKVNWTIPANTTYDKIYVYMDGHLMSLLEGNAVEYKQPLDHPTFQAYQKLKFRIVGVKNKTSSDVSIVELNTPH